MTRTESRIEFAVSSAIAIGLVAGMFLLQHFAPVLYVLATAEDHAVEYIGAFAFLAAAGLIGLSLIGDRRAGEDGPALRSVLRGGFALALFFVGMEEISWGQRILGIETPEFVREANSQKELTLHNLPGVSDVVAVSKGAWVVVAWLAFSVLLAGLLPKAAARLRGLGFPLLPWPSIPFFLAFAYVVYEGHLVKHWEVAESLLGIACLLLALQLMQPDASAETRSFRKRLLTQFGVLALVTSAGAGMSIAHSARATSRLVNAALYDYPRLGMPEQALAVHEHLAALPRTRRIHARVHHARLLKQLQRHAEADSLLATLADELRGDGDDESSERIRDLAEIDLLRGHVEAASAGFDRAIALDEAALAKAKEKENASDPERVATIRWSLARTIHARGRTRDALEIVKELSDERRTPGLSAHLRHQLALWHRRIHAVARAEAKRP